MLVMDMNWSLKEAVKKVLKPANSSGGCTFTFADTSSRLWIKLESEFRIRLMIINGKKCKKMRHIFYKDSSQLNEKQLWYLNRYLSTIE